MPIYRAPVEDTLFVLNDVLGYQRYSNLPGFADTTPARAPSLPKTFFSPPIAMAITRLRTQCGRLGHHA
jgi:hypothetical protein